MTGWLVSCARWAADFEMERRSARFWSRTILVSSGATLLLIGLTRIPPLREFFSLAPAVPLALLALRLAAYFAFVAWEARRGTSRAFFVAGALGMGATLQLVVSSLVVSSEGPGAFVLAVLSVVGAAYNAMILRATPAFPWPALVHAAAMAAVLAFRPTTPYVQIFAVAGPLAVGGGIFLGTLSDAMARSRQLLEQHRRAIATNALQERSGEARRLSSTLLELLERSHDASSSLSTALLDAELLADLIRRGDAKDPKEVQAAARSLRDALRRMTHDPAGALRGGADEPIGAVLAVPAVRAAFAEASRRFPNVAFETEVLDPEAELAEATLRGGAPELERILAELAKNACEGDGTRGAARIRATLDVERETNALRIRVADDGPGLPDAALAETPVAFVTTKARGSGLGLYTAARVVAASSGSLSLANAPEGGAVVTIRLPLRE